MKIVCPQCTFGRDVPDDRMPGKAVVATCPRCKHRFRVSADAPQQVAASGAPAPFAPSASTHGEPLGAQDSSAPRTPYSNDNGDDPLPPGAIIPRTEDASDYPSQGGGSVQPMAPPVPPTKSGASGQSDSSATSSAPRRGSSNFEDEMEAQRRASEAYARQAEAAAQQESVDDFAIDNPWENPRFGYPAAFYQTSMRVMFAAPRFFAGLAPQLSLVRPLTFYLAVGVLQIIVERIWGSVLSKALTPAAGADPQLQSLLLALDPDTSLFMTVLLRAAAITLQLFFAAFLYHVSFRLVIPKHANFSLVFQVLAYSSAPALLCIVPVAGSIAGFIWGLACSFIGCRYALRLTMQQTIMAMIPVFLLALPLIFLVLQGVSAVLG